MRDWILEHFNVTEKDWYIGNNVYVDTFSFNNHLGEKVSSRIDQFVENFNVQEINLDTLKAADPQDVLGWHVHFTTWKNNGIIN
jgi:hypothetical protein